jgi:hypothetical protein
MEILMKGVPPNVSYPPSSKEDLHLVTLLSSNNTQLSYNGLMNRSSLWLFEDFEQRSRTDSLTEVIDPTLVYTNENKRDEPRNIHQMLLSSNHKANEPTMKRDHLFLSTTIGLATTKPTDDRIEPSAKGNDLNLKSSLVQPSVS